MIRMTTRSGQTIRVSEDRVAAWEARGYTRADQPADEAPAEAAPAKRTAKKSSKSSK